MLWFHYSGHGSQEADRSGSESDGLSETIIPIDYTTNGSIVDNDLYRLLVQPLKKGVTLYAIFDWLVQLTHLQRLCFFCSIFICIFIFIFFLSSSLLQLS